MYWTHTIEQGSIKKGMTSTYLCLQNKDTGTDEVVNSFIHP